MVTGADSASAGEGRMTVKRDSTLNSEMAREARSNDLCSRLGALTQKERKIQPVVL